ncbi:endonuclease/Exonuclease/phosphatase [Poronia punctata]|nr:endonuclease/Exonuclease/phosphatase [Poronia punctata]
MQMQTMKNSVTALLLVGTSATVAAAVTSGSFNVLSMNVAGLPAFLNNNGVPGDKKTNSELIGSKLGEYAYDLIHLQEDFNYHAYVYKTDTHPHRTSTSGGVPFGSGLNTLANNNWVDFTRVKWSECSDASEFDCLTPKGFTLMRYEISEGVYVDAYNVHADAGTEPGDLRARASNIRQVAEYIDARSAGNAVLVFGDTNSRWTRAGDVLDVWTSPPAGLADTWVELVRDGVAPSADETDAPPCDNPASTETCETVDKIFYRGSPLVDLVATHFAYESPRFLQADGASVLSDHNPITVNFTWTAGASLRQSPFWGGPHGTWFSDVPALVATSSPPKATHISFRGASRLDAVSITLSDGTTLTHGGTGGSISELALNNDDGETWTGAELCRGKKKGHTRNFYIKATTSAGRTLEAGTRTDDCATFEAPAGWAIVGFLGQDGDEMDQLAFVYAPQ